MAEIFVIQIIKIIRELLKIRVKYLKKVGGQKTPDKSGGGDVNPL